MVHQPLDYSRLRLWPHQLNAVQSCEAYFQSGSRRGSLVHMPTGTGKTGVMAVLAARRAIQQPVLVVCPSAALVDQLQEEFKKAFWTKIGAGSEWQPGAVLKILPSNVNELANELIGATKQSPIIVGTIQAVQQIHARRSANPLNGLIGTVIFDEGHREPAPLWADVVRGFAVPTVLFSATPFRGDFKIFDVDDNHIHFLSFEEAVDKALIRGVEIVEKELSHDARKFAEQVVAARRKLIAQGRFDKRHKVIVRAASETTVTELFQAFSEVVSRRDEGVLALHNNLRLAGQEGWQQRPDVPRQLHARPERFLIHQFMLTEGIDDPSCTMLAIYEPFTNERMLVQQVGRLTRQPGAIGTKAPDAYVLARRGDGVERAWNAFLTYDRACVIEGGRPPIRNNQDVLKKLVAALPNMDYVTGKFRERIDLESDELGADLRFPRAAVIYEIEPSLGLSELQTSIVDALEADDRVVQYTGVKNTGDCRFHATLRFNQSPFLATSLFQTASLEVTIYSKQGARLFFYDSAGLWIDDLKGLGTRVDPKTLRSLLRAGSGNVISFFSLNNTDLSPLALRNRTMSARSLERSGVFMGEHLYVINRVTGRVDKRRRAVGFARSRVRDSEGAELTADEFARWCAELNQELNDASPPVPVLSRFSIPTDVPTVTDPVNILVDMSELIAEFGGTENEAAFLDQANLCVDVFADPEANARGPFRFELTLDKDAIPVWIEWMPQKRKYWLTSPGLSSIKSRYNEKISLTHRLNQVQPFRIITGDCKHIYMYGSFYAQNLSLSDPGGSGQLVLDLITPVQELAAITSEKGIPKDKRRTWQSGSLFRLIDDALVKGRGTTAFGQTFSALVCDDLGTEVADFIGVDEDGAPRVVFVVAKWHEGQPGVSASAFYDVLAQAAKNLAYLKSDGEEIPGKATKWDDDWTLSKGKGASKKVDRVPRRRTGPPSREFRKLLRKVRTAPMSERSIWLVCAGGMLSKGALEREFRCQPPKAHVLQFYHLVISAYSSCQSVGVNLKIFGAD